MRRSSRLHSASQGLTRPLGLRRGVQRVGDAEVVQGPPDSNQVAGNYLLLGDFSSTSDNLPGRPVRNGHKKAQKTTKSSYQKGRSLAKCAWLAFCTFSWPFLAACSRHAVTRLATVSRI